MAPNGDVMAPNGDAMAVPNENLSGAALGGPALPPPTASSKEKWISSTEAVVTAGSTGGECRRVAGGDADAEATVGSGTSSRGGTPTINADDGWMLAADAPDDWRARSGTPGSTPDVDSPAKMHDDQSESQRAK
jgi:hypothetical protein